MTHIQSKKDLKRLYDQQYRKDRQSGFQRTPRKFENPFTEKRLRELYEVEKLTGNQIAKRAAELMDWSTVPTENTAIKWVREAGIRVRTSSECRVINHAQNPDRREQLAEVGRSRKGLAVSPHAGRSFATWTPQEREIANAKRRGNRAAFRGGIKHDYVCRVCQSKVSRYACTMKNKRFCFCKRECQRQFTSWWNTLPEHLRDVIPSDVNPSDGHPM